MVENIWPYVLAGIIVGVFVLIFIDMYRTRYLKKVAPKTFTQDDWAKQRELALKKQRLAKHSKTTAQDTINSFKIKSFELKKEKFSDYPKIKCLSCEQIFHCNWGDEQLVSHQEQELIISKKWKGFKEI